MSDESGDGAPRTVRAIAFDWGGVFTEGTFDGRAVLALADVLGVDEATMREHYYPAMVPLEVGEVDLTTFARRVQEELGTSIDEATFLATFLGAARERTAMFDVLRGIPERFTVGMLSNNVPELCDRVRDDPRMSRIEHFSFSNEIRVRKPDAAAFAALSESLGVPPGSTLFVDDNEANVAACEALGFMGLLVDSAPGFARRWAALLPELEGLVDGPAWGR